MTQYGLDPIDDEGEMSRCAPDVDTIKIEWDKDSLTRNTFPTDKRSRSSSHSGLREASPLSISLSSQRIARSTALFSSRKKEQGAERLEGPRNISPSSVLD